MRKFLFFLFIANALFINASAFSCAKINTDTSAFYTGFFFQHKKTNDTSKLAFPYILPDTSTSKINYSNYYYAYDSLHFHEVNLQKSDFYQTKNTTTEFAQLRPSMPIKWVFYFILVLAIIVVFVKSFFTRYFNELWRSFFNLNNAMQMMRQQDLVFSVPGFLLSINFYVALALFFFLHLHRQKLQIAFNELWLIPALVAVIMGYILFRFLIYRISILLFSNKNILQSISFIDLLQMEFTGIILVPTILILAFGSVVVAQIFWYIAFAMLASIAVYRLITAWRIGGHLLFDNLFHFILYLCSVEIAPILILLKWIQQWSVLQ